MGVGAGLHMYDVVVKKFTFAISSRDEFLLYSAPNRQVSSSYTFNRSEVIVRTNKLTNRRR